jgi:alkylation response protein AidB-like acyl-CoA dehydrogenase
MAGPRSHGDWLAVIRQLGPAFAARAAAHDADDSFVADNYKDLRAHRLFSAGVPVELGGGGASQAELTDVLRLLATYCSLTALALSMHTHQVLIPTWRWRHERAPVEPFLRRVAAEELILVSTGGSDWVAGSGTAEKVEGGYRISGRKIFSSGAPAGDLLMTMAIYEDPTDGPTVLHFAVPLNAPGVKVQDTWRTLGMRGTGSHDTVLDDVFVPDAAIGVRRPAGRWSLPMHVTAAQALPIIYSVYVGVAEAARALALDVVAKKRDDPTIQRLVGEMENALTAARQVTCSSPRRVRREPRPPARSSSDAPSSRTRSSRRWSERWRSRAAPGSTEGSGSSVSSGTSRVPAIIRCASPRSCSMRGDSRSVSTSTANPRSTSA